MLLTSNKFPGIKSDLIAFFLRGIHESPWSLASSGREKRFRADQINDMMVWISAQQRQQQTVGALLPMTRFIVVTAANTARPGEMSMPPTHVILAGRLWLIWRLNDDITVAQANAAAAALAKQLNGGEVAMGKAVPLPGSVALVRQGINLVGKYPVQTLHPLPYSYRFVDGKLARPQVTAGARAAPRRSPTGKSVLLGHDNSKQPVHWAPFETEQRLLNFGILVTGDSGSGKTQTLRVLIDGVVKMGLPVCIFDFKNDYADKEFTQRQKLRVHDVRRDGIPFNPLAPSAADDGKAQPIEHIFTIVGVLKRVFGMGDRQAALLRDAMKTAFEMRGVDPQTWAPANSIQAPAFNDVIAILKAQEKNATAASVIDRLSPLFELGLFPDGKGHAPFEKTLDERIVLSLFNLPSDEIKAAMAELIIIRLHGYLVRREQPRTLTRLLVLDEAWRVTASKHLENLAREGRAFGVGLAIGTQYPGDLPPDLAGSLATRIFLKNQQPDHRKAVVAAVAGGATGPQAQEIAQFLERQEMFQGIIQNQQFAPYVRFTLAPYYLRK